MVLDKELAGNYAVATPYSPDDFRLGYEDSAKYFLNRKISKILLDGKSRIYQLHQKYLKSYLSSRVLTVRAYRDMLMSLALIASARSVQSKDSNYSTLTTQSKRYWSTSTVHFWETMPTYEQYEDTYDVGGLYGLAGSLAFSMYSNLNNGNGLLPLDFLKQVLTYNLESIDSTYEDTAVESQSKLFSSINLNNIPYTQIELAFNKIIADGVNTPYLDMLKKVRDNLLTVNDWNNLKQRLILGEYSDLTMECLKYFINKCFTDSTFKSYYSIPETDLNCFSILEQKQNELFPTTGSVLFYQAMHLKGIVKTIELLESLPDAVFNSEFSLLLVSTTYQNLVLQCGANVATSYDACGALSLFQTIYEAEGLSYRYFLTSLQIIRNLEKPYISEAGSTRLLEFIKN